MKTIIVVLLAAFAFVALAQGSKRKSFDSASAAKGLGINLNADECKVIDGAASTIASHAGTIKKVLSSTKGANTKELIRTYRELEKLLPILLNRIKTMKPLIEEFVHIQCIPRVAKLVFPEVRDILKEAMNMTPLFKNLGLEKEIWRTVEMIEKWLFTFDQ